MKPTHLLLLLAPLLSPTAVSALVLPLDSTFAVNSQPYMDRLNRIQSYATRGYHNLIGSRLSLMKPPRVSTMTTTMAPTRLGGDDAAAIIDVYPEGHDFSLKRGGQMLGNSWVT